jgi:DNA-directed RNA polymerase specialized sigma24 family protein
MLIEDGRIVELLRRIVTRFTEDPVLQEDLAQESLLRLWMIESEKPGRTRSWYLQNCRFHLQHWLASGRSLDSPKRAIGDNRITIDGISDERVLEWYHTNGEVIEIVSARDIVATLARHLKPRESAMLGGLADGLVLRDIAISLKLSSLRR